MKKLLFLIFAQCALGGVLASPKSSTVAGFSIPDSIIEVRMKYQRILNLILLPVTINDSIHVNLILDTGCRNLILFGKRFNKMLDTHPDRRIEFSGLGSGKPLSGRLSLGNKVAIDAVMGRNIPVVIVPSQNLFGAFPNVDGVIGYDIFIKFEVELNLARQLITFRSAMASELAYGYEKIAIHVEDALPVIRSEIFFNGMQEGQPCDLILDTGSSLGLLVKTTDLKQYPAENRQGILGRGLNGKITGTQTLMDKLILGPLEMKPMLAGIIYSPFHNRASIGMEVLGNYSIILNYCKGYAGFKSNLL